MSQQPSQELEWPRVVRLPLVYPTAQRTNSLAKDSYNANCFEVPVNGKLWTEKRRGVPWFKSAVGSTGVVGPETGLYYFSCYQSAPAQGSVLIAGVGPHGGFGSHVLVVSLSSIVAEPLADFAGFGGIAIYGQKAFAGADEVFVFQDYATASIYTITLDLSPTHFTLASVGGGVTGTTEIVGGLVTLDYYHFIMDAKGRIFNSDLNDPSTWSAANFIMVQTDNSQAIFLARHLSYVVAMKRTSITLLYNAGQAAPGSPLLPYTAATYEVGCDEHCGVQDIAGNLCWVGISKEGARAVYMMSAGGTGVERISTPDVDKMLARISLSSTPSNMFDPAHVWPYWSTQQSYDGHAFYILTFNPAASIDTPPFSYVYDIPAKKWTVFTYSDDGTERSFPFRYNCTDDSANQYMISGTEIFEPVKVHPASIPTSDGSLDGLGTEPIKTIMVTPPLDGDTTQTKFVPRLELVGDKQAGSTIAMTYTDDDYQTFSAARTIDLSIPRSQARNLGQTRRRAFKFVHTADTPLRLEALEVELDLGIS